MTKFTVKDIETIGKKAMAEENYSYSKEDAATKTKCLQKLVCQTFLNNPMANMHLMVMPYLALPVFEWMDYARAYTIFNGGLGDMYKDIIDCELEDFKNATMGNITKNYIWKYENLTKAVPKLKLSNIGKIEKYYKLFNFLKTSQTTINEENGLTKYKLTFKDGDIREFYKASDILEKLYSAPKPMIDDIFKKWEAEYKKDGLGCCLSSSIYVNLMSGANFCVVLRNCKEFFKKIEGYHCVNEITNLKGEDKPFMMDLAKNICMEKEEFCRVFGVSKIKANIPGDSKEVLLPVMRLIEKVGYDYLKLKKNVEFKNFSTYANIAETLNRTPTLDDFNDECKNIAGAI